MTRFLAEHRGTDRQHWGRDPGDPRHIAAAALVDEHFELRFLCCE